MNYYERIQKSIDYIEKNLENDVDLNKVALEAYMSLSNFYRIFFALTGHAVKEYIRKRRISLAAEDIIFEKDTIMRIAVKYRFSGSDTFSKAFKQIVGWNPTTFKKKNLEFNFNKISILDRYYEMHNDELLEKYPDIKVLKEMKPMRVAYYKYFGKNPEYHAFKVLLEWAKSNNLLSITNKYRLFGYDTLDCRPGSDEYGYEACITIDDDFNFVDDKVKEKELNGGMYAVTTIGVKDIPKAWQRFKSWVKMSKYDFGAHQFLEEHMEGINEDYNYNVELYMPISEKCKYSIEIIDDFNVVMCKVLGDEETAPFEAWETLLNWAKSNGILETSKKHKFFAHHNYNIKRKGIKRWYMAMVTVDDDVILSDKNLKKEKLVGGKFVMCNTDFKRLSETWKDVVNWIGLRAERINPKVKWREEWHIKDGKVFPETYPNIRVYAPIKD